MATSIDVIKTLTVQGRSVGMDKVAADLKAVAGGQEQVAQSSVKLVSATATVERGTLSAQRQLDNLTKSMDPLTNAMAKLERIQRAAGSVQSQGGVVSEANTRAIANAKARVDELIASTEKHTEAVGLNRIQQLEAVHVAKSFVDQVIAGQSPMRALAVEGGRIAQIFSLGTGGVGGTLKAVGSSVASLATGWLGLGVATAGAAALGVVALTHYTDQQHKLAEALDGTGRAAGLTVSQLDAVAKAGARGTNLSGGDAVDLAASYAHAGFGGAVTQAAIGVTPLYGRATGQDTADAGKSLADALSDPASGFATLDKSVGSLDDRLRTTVRTLQDSGQIEAARLALADGLNRSLADTTDRSTRLSRAFEGVEHSLGGFVTSLGAYLARQINGPSLDEQIATLQKRLASSTNPGGRGSGQFERQQDSDRANLARLTAQRDEQTRKVADEASRANAARVSQQAGDAVREILPEIVRAQTASSQITLLRTALSDPQTMAAMGVTRGQTVQALSNVSVQQSYSDPIRRMVDDNKLAIQSIEAFSLAERVAVEARRAELEVLRESGDLTKASVAAEAARNQEIARANNAASDRLDQAKQDAALVGLSPFERRQQEIRNQFEGVGGFFDKDSASKSELTAAMRPVEADLKSAGQLVVNALRDVAGGIRGVTGGGAGLPFFAGGGALSAAPSNVQAMIQAAAAQTGQSAAIIAAIGQKENGYKLTGGTSLLGSNGRPSSAYGYGQLTDGAAHDVAAAVPGFNKYNPATAVFGSAAYLSILQRRNGGDLTAALNSYGGTAGYANDIYRRAGAGALAAAPAQQAIAPIASTARADDQQSENLKLAADRQEQLAGPLKAANDALQQQINLLNVQKTTVGQSAAQVQAAAEAQRLFDQYTAMDPNHAAGVDAWKKISDGVDAYRTKLAQTLQATTDFQAQQQKTIGTLDTVRSSGDQALSGFLTGIRGGQTAGQAFNNVLGGIENKLLDFASNQIITSLFGKTGTAGGGALGGGLSSLLAGIFHEGGIVGGMAPGRVVPAAMFAGAPRHHSGYGLAADERPAILQTGEAVVSRADLAAARAQKSQAAGAAGSASTGAMLPPIINNYASPGGAQVDSKVERGPDGRTIIHNTVVDAVLADLASNGKISRAMNKFGGVGRTGG